MQLATATWEPIEPTIGFILYSVPSSPASDNPEYLRGLTMLAKASKDPLALRMAASMAAPSPAAPAAALTWYPLDALAPKKARPVAMWMLDDWSSSPHIHRVHSSVTED